MKGAYLHMAADALVSVGVVVSGIIITYTGWSIIDPIIGLGIAVIIIVSTWGLLHDSLRLSLDGVPVEIDAQKDTATYHGTTRRGELPSPAYLGVKHNGNRFDCPYCY